MLRKILSDKQAIVYCRVSTQEQKNKGSSIDRQLEDCRAYASSKEMEIIAEITDDFSGGTLERPGFLQLRALLAEGKANAVVVFRQDRLSRDSADYMYLRKQWGRAGIELHFCDRGRISYDFSGIVLDSTMSGVNEGERWLIRDRTMNGRLKKAKNNVPVMMGQPPYGYNRVGYREDARLVINEDQKKIVLDIFNWYVHGNGSEGPLSLEAIARKLDGLGVPPPGYKNRRAKCWYASSIGKFLANEVYVGRLYYQKIRVEWNKRIQQPKDKWIRIDVPELAIIDRATFDAAQKRKKKNKERAKRNRKNRYLLTGHIRCGSCGYAAIGLQCTAKKNSTKSYYRCGTYTKKHVECICGNRSIAAYKIDDAVWNWLVWILSDDDNLNSGLRELVENRKQTLNPKLEKYDSIVELIDNADSKINRLVTELSKNDDEIVLTAIREQIRTVSQNRESLDSECGRLENELSQLEISEEMEDQIKALAAKVRDRLPGASYEEKKRILDMLDVRVNLHLENQDDKYIEVNCEIPLPSCQSVWSSEEESDIKIVTRTS